MSRGRWICLMYHDVTGGAVGVSGGAQHFSVARGTFARQLDLLRDQGLQGRSIAACFAQPVENQVAISFDDGDLGQFENGCAELSARGMTATFFVATSWVGRSGYVSWSQLREMKAAGMSVQSHSRTHPFLSELDETGLRSELQGSKARLDEELDQETDTIALPGGDRPRRALQPLLATCGYRIVATSRWGTNAWPGPGGNPSWVRRCTIRGTPTDEWFLRVLAADPWLRLRRVTREATLGSLREALGPSRYARWRRRLLGTLGG